MSESEHQSLEERTRFDPAEVEPRILEAWLESGLFHPEAEGQPEESYSVAFRPPNVTGDLHMGHALEVATQDTLIRYQRMLGHPTKLSSEPTTRESGRRSQVEKSLRPRGHVARGDRP